MCRCRRSIGVALGQTCALASLWTAFWALALPAAASPNVSLAWDANTESDLAGYIVNYGTAAGQYTNLVDVGNVTNSTVSNLQYGVTYYFVVTAYNASGLESDPSNEVSYDAPANQVSISGVANQVTSEDTVKV